jgi:hypothetical protein
MSRRYWLIPALALALVVSLGLNAALLLRPRAALAPPRRSAVERPAVQVQPDPRARDRCPTELAACRTAGLTLALGALRPAPRPTGDPAPQPEPEPAEDETTLRRAALCEVAQEHLRRHWETQRPSLITSLRRSTSDPDVLAANLRQQVAAFAADLGLGDADRDAIGRAYAPIRQARIAAVNEALAADPPDVEAALNEALELYAQEDDLVRQRHGAAAEQRWRSTQRQVRTIILSILASLAGIPFEESTTW